MAGARAPVATKEIPFTMMINPYATRSRVGVRPDARLAQAFLTQAFFWMFLGLLLTTGIGAVVAGMSDTQLTSLEGLVFPLIIGQLAIAFTLTLAIRRIPASVGLLLFFAYAALTGVTFGFILRIYDLGSVVAAGSAAAAVFGAAAFYGAVTKRDLSNLGAYLFMGLIGLMVAMVVNLFIGWSFLSFGLSVAAAVIFTVLTAYDVQQLLSLIHIS